MKRIIPFFLSIILLCSCGKTTSSSDPVYEFFYPQENMSYYSENGVLVSEKRSFPAGLDFLIILNRYIQGPETVGLTNPFPQNLEVLDLNVKDATVTLLLSDAISQAGGMELTLICCCLAKTCMTWLECETVMIQGKDVLLNDVKALTFSADSMIFEDPANITDNPN